jgi:hypothetical protein
MGYIDERRMATISLDAIMAGWKRELSDAQIRQYPSDVRRLQQSFGKDVDLGSLGRDDITTFFSSLRDNQTKRRVVAATRHLFRYLYRSGALPADPAALASAGSRARVLDRLTGGGSSTLTYESWLVPILEHGHGTPLQVGERVCQIPRPLWKRLAREFAEVVHRADSADEIRDVLTRPLVDAPPSSGPSGRGHQPKSV